VDGGIKRGGTIRGVARRAGQLHSPSIKYCERATTNYLLRSYLCLLRLLQLRLVGLQVILGKHWHCPGRAGGSQEKPILPR